MTHFEADAAPIDQWSATELAERRDRGEAFRLIDVRTPHEREYARIEPSELLDQALAESLIAEPGEAPIVFYCHHGVRSQAAAEYFRQHGLKSLINLRGGIEAYSVEVDPSVPRY